MAASIKAVQLAKAGMALYDAQYWLAQHRANGSNRQQLDIQESMVKVALDGQWAAQEKFKFDVAQ